MIRIRLRSDKGPWTTVVKIDRRARPLDATFHPSKKSLSDQITSVQKSLNQLKIHLGELGEPSYPEEVTNNNDPKGVRCEPGNVVTGMKIEEKRTFIYCTSLGRAAWNPGTYGANEQLK
jgi:hypothetical protein